MGAVVELSVEPIAWTLLPLGQAFSNKVLYQLRNCSTNLPYHLLLWENGGSNLENNEHSSGVKYHFSDSEGAK